MTLLKDADLLSKDDRLILFGYGIFETLRVNGIYIEVPQLHYQRMRRGAQELGLTMPDYEVWLGGLQEIVGKKAPADKEDTIFALRVTLSGGSEPEVPPRWLYHSRPIPYSENVYNQGIAAAILSRPRNEHSPLVQLKSTNYMENILAKREAEEKGAREGIWLNTKGYLAEGTMSNLFFVKEGILYTPSLECGCLPGTRRQLTLECAKKLGIPCVEGEFLPHFIEDAEEVFLTNALMGIMPVSKVNGARIPLLGSVRGAVNKQLKALLRK